MMNPTYSLTEANLRYDRELAAHVGGLCANNDAPVIGITTNLGEKGAELARGYWASIRKAGGTPLLLAPTDDPQELIAQLEQIDGLLLSGGADLNPLWLGEDPVPELHGICPERDLYELQLCRLAHQRNVPVMGICRGCQMMAAALGGTLLQHIDPSAYPIKHSQSAPRSEATHKVEITDESGVFSAVQGAAFVNSFHHQAVHQPGPLMHVSAVASDGVVEAIEGNTYESFLLGVQWHPECMNDELSAHLFRSFIEAAKLYCRALELHAAILTLDSHCDTPMMFPNPDEPISMLERNARCLVDVVKAAEGHLDETFMVSYIPQGERTPQGYAEAWAQVDNTYKRLQPMLHGGIPSLYIHFGVENGYAIGKDITLLRRLQSDYGVEYITLCHNGHNDICDSARPKQGEPEQEWGGLSPYGREVVAEMNRLGILIDLSHASEKSFYDVLECSSRPVAVTHACCKALCDHPRNLTDDQLRAIAAKDGVVQCTMYPYFLEKDGKANIDVYMQHLLHMIEVCGIDHVGVGTDFDGDGGVPGLRDASDLMHITQELLRRGFSDNDICRIWGDNFRRVLAAVSVN